VFCIINYFLIAIINPMMVDGDMMVLSDFFGSSFSFRFGFAFFAHVTSSSHSSTRLWSWSSWQLQIEHIRAIAHRCYRGC